MFIYLDTYWVNCLTGLPCGTRVWLYFPGLQWIWVGVTAKLSARLTCVAKFDAHFLPEPLEFFLPLREFSVVGSCIY